jgi:hypothetical protein
MPGGEQPSAGRASGRWRGGCSSRCAKGYQGAYDSALRYSRARRQARSQQGAVFTLLFYQFNQRRRH